MKILKGIILLVVTISVVWGAEEKTKKTDDKPKKAGKRQIGYGLEAIPGVAFHPPLADDGLLAIARPTAHGGIGGYGLVQPIGLIHAPQVDNIGGFTSQGFDGFQGGYGVYTAPQALVAAPIVDIHQNEPKAHQLSGGWKGVDHRHGSIKHGHEIAQSLISKPVAPYQEGIFEVAPILPVVQQFDFGKARNAVYGPNALVQMYSGFGTTAKGFAPVQNLQQYNILTQGVLPNGYNFATFHGNQGSQVGPSYHHIAGHTGGGGQTHKSHGSVSHGHQLASHGHQLAKKVHIPNGHSGFVGSHGTKVHHEKAHVHHHSHQFGKKAAVHPSSHSFGHSVPSRQNYYSPSAPSRHNSYAPSDASRQNYSPSAPSRPVAPLSSEHPSHDSSGHSTSYSTDFNSPKSSYSPDFNPSASLSSYEHSDAGQTNGHGGQHSGEKKATSFQSFIVHSYKPQQVSHKTQYDSHESDENNSGSNYNSAQALSGENHF